MKINSNIKPKCEEGTYYVWVGGSCDYGHEERCSGGAYIMEKDGKIIDEYVISDDHTTEFRMILTVMIHAMEVIPEGSTIVFMTNVAYIQNFDKEPTGKAANRRTFLSPTRGTEGVREQSGACSNSALQEGGKPKVNADLIKECISLKEKHKSAAVKLVPFHKYTQLPRTHEMAHDAMIKLRNR